MRLKDEVLRAMHVELAAHKDYLKGEPVTTVYFGGGTPSLLTADDVKRLLDTIAGNYALNAEEVTLEGNPDDLTTAYIRSLRHTAINRFSIGVQSFRDEDLKYMNRAHNAQQAEYAIKAAQDAGFENLTIDLIYGTPGLDDMAWKANLAMVRDLDIPHFSAYALTVEEGTALHHAILKKTTSPVDHEQSARQFELLMEQAEAMGFEHYEISNLAKKGRYALHNTNYWKGVPYLGIGPSAHSFDRRARRWNIANNSLYATALLKDGKAMFEEEVLNDVQRLNEYIMTSLRTMWGLDLGRVEAEGGSDAVKSLRGRAAVFEEKGWLKQLDTVLVLTPAGKLYADRIAAELFLDE